MIPQRALIRKEMERYVLERMTVQEINEVARELYPYFREVILEERASLRAHMLVEGHFDIYEKMLNEDKQLNEGILSTIGDIAITGGQMIGGSVGQAAGIAGLVKYAPEFQNNVDKEFMEWFGPFISLFFSAQALLFPFPAVASLKTIFTGFVAGVKAILKGSGGLVAKGVTALFAKGSGFISKAIGLVKKAIEGMAKMVGKGGPKVAQIEQKLGGSGTLGKLMGKLKDAAMEFVKRLGVLKEGLVKLGKTNVKEVPGMVKDILTKAFQTSKDKLDDAAAALKGTKAGKAIAAAKTKAGSTLEKALKGITITASDDIAKLTIKGAQLKGAGTTSAQISGIVGGRLTMNYLDDAGKIIYTSAISGDDLVKILAKNPKVKKWMLSNLDDAGRKVASKALSTASSTSKAATVAAAKVTSKASKEILTKFGDDIMKASQAGREALSKFIREYMSKNVAKMNEILKPLFGKSYGQMGEFVGLTSGGAFKFAAPAGEVLGGVTRSVMTVARSGKRGSVYIDKILNQKMAGNLIPDLIAIKDPLIDILLKAFAPLMPRVAKELGRVAAASTGGDMSDFDAEAYKSPIKGKRKKLPGEKGYKSISDKLGLNEHRLLEELMWESQLRRKIIGSQKLISLID